MPYNLDLEERIDHLIDQFGEIAKKKMFGGVGYLKDGNMCFGIYKEYLIVRTSTDKAEDLVKKGEYIKPFDITGKPMKGWLMISPDYTETEVQLLNMLRLGADFVESLPEKRTSKPRAGHG